MIHIGGQFYQRTLFSIGEGVRLQGSGLYTLPEKKEKNEKRKALKPFFRLVQDSVQRKDKTKYFHELTLDEPY